MSSARIPLLIKKVFEEDYTWEQLEKYFSCDREKLHDELQIYCLNEPAYQQRLDGILHQLSKNEKNFQKIEEEIER